MANKVGRPRKYKDSTERMRAFRERQKDKGVRVDIFISKEAIQKLDQITSSLDCSSSIAIQRLILEADE